MKIVILNFEGKVIAKFEWNVAKGQWIATIKDDYLKTWWANDQYLHENHRHQFTNGHFSFKWGSKRIFNLQQKGFDVFVVNWKDWDLIRLDLKEKDVRN